MFYYPNISLTHAQSGDFSIGNEAVPFSEPGNVTIMVPVPEADPPVNCSISTKTKTFYCIWQFKGNSFCNVTIFVGNEEVYEVNVTFAHIAYKSWKTQLLFYVDKIPEGEGEGGSGITTGLVVVAVLVPLSIICLVLFLFYRRSLRKLQGNKTIKENAGTSQNKPTTESNRNSEVSANTNTLSSHDQY